MNLIEHAYQLSHFHSLIICAFHYSLLKMRDHPQQLLKDPIFSSGTVSNKKKVIRVKLVEISQN